MKIIQYTCALLMAFSLVCAGQVEAKHGSEQARSRVLKQISKNESQYSTKKA